MYFKFLLAVSVSVAAVAWLSQPTAANGPAHRSVVVELFTSEGCSSCPPADELLSRLRKQGSESGVEIIPLGFHVDYWNYQGWQDRFSSSQYSKRQESYAAQLRTEGPYTPEMVVDGSQEFVGNDVTRATSAIAAAGAKVASAQVSLKSQNGKLAVSVAGQPDGSGEVWLAITEDNLSSRVAAGENTGRTLHHDAVVRDFRSLGRLQVGKFEKTLPVAFQRDWKPGDLHIVVFVQRPQTGTITGAAEIPAAVLAQ
ncbi:MAG TPA: DUF1223 domain-containing protein [Terriglobales bacterium]|nr:DUF1223 domain-containing protein [Terriglobales bacterium]